MNRRISRGSNLATSIEQSPRRSDAPVTSLSRRAIRAAVAGSALAVTLSACQWTAPVTTMKTYDPGDGVSAHVGTVSLTNLLVVAGQEGGPGNVLGYASNNSDKPAQVAVSTVEAGQQGGGAAPVQVPARGTQQLTAPQGGAATSLPAVQAKPGAMIQLLVRTDSGQTVVDVPVLAPEGYYEQLGPNGGGTAAPTG